MQEKNNLALDNITLFVKEKFGKDLPDGIDNLEILLKLVDKEIERQEKIDKRKQEILKQFGFVEKDIEKKELKFDDGYFDKLSDVKLTNILKNINPSIFIDGVNFRLIAKKNGIPAGLLLLMLQVESLVLDKNMEENKKILNDYAKIVSIIWKKGATDLQSLAKIMNNKNKKLYNILQKIYNSLKKSND